MWPSKTIEEIAQSLQNKKEVIFIAKVGGKIIGFVYGIIRNDYIEGVSEYPVLYVEGIFVEENYRHQKVASSLIEKLVESSKERNIKKLLVSAEKIIIKVMIGTKRIILKFVVKSYIL